MAYFRSLESILQARLDEEEPLIQVIVGPRQVGKSTAIQQALAGRGIYESADSPAPLNFHFIERWWERTLQLSHPILAIDEIQKIPGWSEVIKKLWDKKRDTPLKLVISGSAALAIEKNLRESLAGRYELIRAEHWNFSEAHQVFKMSLRQFIEYGCYPGSMRFIQDTDRWASYIRDSIIEPVIGRDVLQLHPVKNPSLLRQLFAVAASLPAQLVSLQKLQGQLQDSGAIATIQHYLDLLGHGFMVTALQKFSRSQIRSKRSSPKLIIHDNGLMRALERPANRPLSQEQFGHYFENAIISRFIEAGWETYYWREREKEVDLVALGPSGEKLAIEAKSNHASEAAIQGLRDFCSRYPEFTPCLVSYVNQSIPGVQTLSTEKVLGLSHSTSQIF